MSADVIFMDKEQGQREADQRLIGGENAAAQFGGGGKLYWPIDRRKA